MMLPCQQHAWPSPRPLVSAGTGFAPGCRWLLPTLVLVLAGCQAGDRPEPLTLAEFEAAQERQAARIERRLDAMREAHDERLDDQERSHNLRLLRHELRLSALEQGLGEVLGRLPREESSTSETDETTMGLPPPDGELLLFGSRECVSFPEHGLVLHARVDSGAMTSSIHTVDPEEFERDGNAWVRFSILGANGNDNADAQEAGNEESGGNDVDSNDTAAGDEESDELRGDSATTIEAPIVRRVRIRQATGDERRVVVRLPVRVGPLAEEAEFTLADRGDMSLPILLGRRFMMDVALIDVSREYLQPCPDA